MFSVYLTRIFALYVMRINPKINKTYVRYDINEVSYLFHKHQSQILPHSLHRELVILSFVSMIL